MVVKQDERDLFRGKDNVRRFWSCCLSLAFMYPRKCSVAPGKGALDRARYLLRDPVGAD